MGSESDIELVAVSCKLDFSERRNLPNKEMDPDHKLPKGFRSPPSHQFIFRFPSHPLLKYIKGSSLSRRLFPQPLLLLRLSRPLFSQYLFSLVYPFADSQCPTIPPSVAVCRRPQDPPPEKSARNPGRPKLKVQCALSLAVTPVG